MICPGMEERLNDYADGSLSDPDRREVERHLETCAGCREAADDLKSLVSDLSALPRAIDPPRDLWPATARAVRAGTYPGAGEWTSAPPRTHRAWRGPAMVLAAAAMVLIVAAAAYRMGWLPAVGRNEPGPAAVVAADSGILPDVAAAEDEFNRATEGLLEALRRRGGDLPPETLSIIEKNIRIIDEAIAESRAALRSDPSNPRLGHMVTAAYQRKVDLLREAARLPAPVRG